MSSGVKFSTTSDLHEWYIKLFLSACTFQKYIYIKVIWAFTFEICPFVWIQTMIVVEKVLKCRMAIIDYNKSIIHITLQIVLIDSVEHTTIPTKCEFNTTLLSEVMKFQKLWTLIISKLVLWHLSTSSTTSSILESVEKCTSFPKWLFHSVSVKRTHIMWSIWNLAKQNNVNTYIESKVNTYKTIHYSLLYVEK